MQRFVTAIGLAGLVALQGCSDDETQSQNQYTDVQIKDVSGPKKREFKTSLPASQLLPGAADQLPAGSVKLENVVYQRETADESTQLFYTTLLRSMVGQMKIFASAHGRAFHQDLGPDQTLHWISYTKEDVAASREENIRRYRSEAKQRSLTPAELQDAMIHYCFDVEVVPDDEQDSPSGEKASRKRSSRKKSKRHAKVEVWRITFKMIPPATLEDSKPEDVVGVEDKLMRQFLPELVQIDMSPQIAELSAAFLFPVVLDTTDTVKTVDL